MTLEILRQRGLLDAALAAGWVVDGNGWSYPVFNARGQPYMVDGTPVRRWKSADGSSPKYLWKPRKPAGVRYYLQPDTVAAIDDASVLFLASGEPDVLAFRAAGTTNTLCWFDGEGSVPPTLVADLQRLNVAAVKYYPDRDRTGLETAAKLLAVFAGSGISFSAYELPASMGSKYDINDLWCDCDCDAERFAIRLMQLPQVSTTDLYLYGSSANDAPAPLGSGGITRIDAKALHREWIGKIIDALGQPVKREGNVDRWHCPTGRHVNGDRNPSLRIATDKNPDFPWPVCSCELHEEADAWSILGAALGVDRWQEFKARKRAEGYEVADDIAPPMVARVSGGEDEHGANFVTSSSAIKNVRLLLRGEIEIDIPPMIFPFNRLHQFDGSAWISMPRKLTYVLGVSGGGKTFFSEQLDANMRKDGYDSLYWGPEWSPEEMVYRSIQRAGGSSQQRVLLHHLWTADKQAGVPDHLNRGEQIGAAAIERDESILNSIERWPGMTHYIDESDLPPTALVVEIRKHVKNLRSEGRKVQSLFIDYLQLWNNSGGNEEGALGPERAVNQIKLLIQSLGLFGFIVLQPRKGDSEQAREGEVLHHASAQGLSDQRCNLMLGLTPIFDEDGCKLNEAKIAVLKNSMGNTGSIRVPVDWPKLLWHDVQHSTAPKL